MLSWNGKLREATHHELSTRTNTHASPVYLLHTPSMVPNQRTFFTYGTASGLPSPYHDSSS